MGRSPVKKKAKTPEFKMPEGMENLSESERRAYMVQTGRSARGISSEEGTVSQKAHDDEVRKLREEIGSLKSKIDDVKGERDQLRTERDDYKKRFEAKLDELSDAGKDIEALRRERSELSEKNKSLASELKRAMEASPPRRTRRSRS